MNFQSVNDLCNLIRNNLSKIPSDVDLIVGIPRSGLFVANYIALLMNKPLTDIDGFISGRIFCSGRTKDTSRNIKSLESCKKVLIVDDSIASGISIEQCKKKLDHVYGTINKIYCVAYALESSRHMVDICFEILNDPRLFEWNLFSQKLVLFQTCFDLDGVLCDDPNPEQNDDGEKYRDFIKNAKVKIRPTGIVGFIVTSRLTKYRELTEEWLTKNHIQYGKLIMLNATAEERAYNDMHATFKANCYKKEKSILFVESERMQAITINYITKKPVYCVETGEFFCGNMAYEIKYESKAKIRAFFRKSKFFRMLYYKFIKRKKK